MKKYFLPAVCCVLSIVPVFSQTNTFRFSYDVGSFDISGGMVENSAGEFVIAGLNNSLGPYYGNAIKIDNTGTVVWAKAYTGGFATNFTDIKNVSTGGYIMTGSSTSGGGGALLVKIDNSGNLLWAKTYKLPDYSGGNASTEYGNAVIETSDGGFLVGGGVDYFWDGVSAGTVDTASAFGFKTDASGNLLWSKVWTLTNPTKADEHFFNDVAESSDGYFFVGESADETQTYDSEGDLPRDALVIKTDKAAGTTTYVRRWGHSNSSSQGINSALTLITGANSGKILLGGYDDIHAFLITVEGTGGTPTMGAFNRRINGASFPPRTLIIQDIMENADGNYSVIGMQIEPLSFLFYTAIYKINSGTGAIIFGRGYVPIGLSAILPEGGLCSDQGYYVSMTDQQAGGFNYNVIRTNTVGQLGSGPAGCNSTNLNPSTTTYSTTLSTPASSEYNLAGSSSFSPAVTNLTPVRTQDCANIICSKPPGNASAAPATICAGQSTTLTASGGTSYSWSTGATTASIVVSPASTTAYTATVTASGCDSIPPPVTVTVNPLPSASISGNTNICVGDATTLTASGGGTYVWNTGATTPSITASPLVTTSYTVTVTGTNGCTNSASSTVNVVSPPTASISGAASVCSGNSVTLTASGGTSYSWNTGSTNAVITVSPSVTTTYSVTVSNGSCTSTTSATVTVNPLPTAVISGNTNICQGESTTLTASGGTNYSWSTGATTASVTLNPASTTSYTVTITNSNGCTDTAVTTVNVAPPPTASVSGNDTICSGQSTVLTASGGLTYSWNTSATTSSITVSPATNTTYSVIVSAGNCSDTATYAVAVNPTPNANITTASTSICNGQSATLTASGGGTYSWSTGVTTNSIIVSPTIATSYSVIVSNGLCTDTSSVTLTVLPPVTAIVSGSGGTICSGQSATLSASGGTIYSWSSGQTTSSIIVSPSSSTNYTVTVSNGACSDDTSISIPVNPSPTASVTATGNSICAGQSATLTASGNGTYAWNTGATTSVIFVSPTASTTYTLVVTAANGCTASAVSNVAVTPVPNPSITSTAGSICSGDAATLTATGGTTYVWNPGGQTSSSVVVSPSSGTTYTVTASNGNCSSSATTTISVNPSPSVAATNVSVNYGGSSTITASPSGGTPPYTYSWNTGEITSSISVSPTATTVYCVTITDSNGCSDTACSTVTVDYVCGELFIPNAFSPNGDLKNDYFRPRNICFKSLRLIIYDRWGVKVFETEDVNTAGWDGMYKGKIGETAVFNYHFTFELVDGNSGVKKGTVSLIR